MGVFITFPQPGEYKVFFFVLVLSYLFIHSFIPGGLSLVLSRGGVWVDQRGEGEYSGVKEILRRYRYRYNKKACCEWDL